MYAPAVGPLIESLKRASTKEDIEQHDPVAFALLAIGGTFGGITGLIAWLGGTPPERPMAVVG